jgi:hypothetical protein
MQTFLLLIALIFRWSGYFFQKENPYLKQMDIV